MYCGELLSVVILLVCTRISAKPPPVSNWIVLRDNKTLNRYRNSLLSVDVVPFLNTCYDPSCCEEAEDKLCHLYFNAVLWANATKLPSNVSKADVELLTKQADKNSICIQLPAQLKNAQTSSYKVSPEEGFMDLIKCVFSCVDKNDVVHQACILSSWLLGQNEKSVISTVDSSAVAERAEKVAATEKKPLVKPKAVEEASIPVVEKPKVSKVISSAPASPVNLPTEEIVSKKAATVTPETEDTPPVKSPAAQPNVPKVSGPVTVASISPAPSNSEENPEDTDYISQDDLSQNEFNANSANAEVPLLPESVKSNSVPIMEQKSSPDNEKSEEAVIARSDPFYEETGSNFFAYFLFGMFACILLYVVYNNKSKILALILEGRRSQSGRNGRRKHTAAYRKLDTNLEEAITSSTTSGRTSQIIY